MKVPWWARWVAVGPLIRPGDEDDLPAIEWIISKSPNPNSRPLIWWAEQLEVDLRKDEEPVNLTRVAFWLIASLVSRDSGLMFSAATVDELTEVEWRFVIPVDRIARAVLTDNTKLLPYALETPMIGAFWAHIKVFADERTRWTWYWRKPSPATRARHSHKQAAQGGVG